VKPLPLRALLVAGLLAGLFAPRIVPQSARPSCCCPDGMMGACSRMDTGCSLKRCGDPAAISLSAPRIVLPSPPALPAPSEAGRLAILEGHPAAPPSGDPFDPPPRG